ncbi:MAG: conjugative transfer signal peptidase TraF [Nevskiaceae bacterium]|jgi:conjugative transfer signal peptidase TraF|nr:MAG: conjugative transfer signal peptidase TraF [Nevskiaceae bacterium]
MTSTVGREAGSPAQGVATGRKRAGRQRQVVAVLVGASMMMAAVAGIAWLGGLRLNLTPSEPLGLWRIAPLDRPAAVGDLVFICPPPGPVSDFGLERGYFRRGPCDGGSAPLIKTIVARSGAVVVIGAGVEIDGMPLPRSGLSVIDGAGRSLSPWSGVFVPPGFIFLHASFAGSYDSRYFGPVPEAGLLGLARPVLVFDP